MVLIISLIFRLSDVILEAVAVFVLVTSWYAIEWRDTTQDNYLMLAQCWPTSTTLTLSPNI